MRASNRLAFPPENLDDPLRSPRPWMSGPSEAALDRLFEEARLVLQAQREAGSQINEKASQILRFNAILIGVLVTGASLAVRLGNPRAAAGEVPAGVFLGGILLLVGSTMMAVLVYPKTTFRLGLGATGLRGFHEAASSELEVLEEAFDGYVHGIERNREALDAATGRLRTSLGLLLASLSLLLLTTATLLPTW